MEKRIPMAGSMQKMAMETYDVDTVTLEGDNWKLTLPKDIADGMDKDEDLKKEIDQFLKGLFGKKEE